MIHKFACDDCEIIIEDTDTHKIHVCKNCGRDMRWCMRLGGTNGDYNHVSDSLAINPSQIAEHRAHFPNVDILPDGRPHFTSVKQQSDYVDKCGFHKHIQKIKPKGKRLKVS